MENSRFNQWMEETHGIQEANDTKGTIVEDYSTEYAEKIATDFANWLSYQENNMSIHDLLEVYKREVGI